MSDKKESFRIAFDGSPWERPPHSQRRVLSLLVDSVRESGWAFELWMRNDMHPDFASFRPFVRMGPESWRDSKADVFWCSGFPDKATPLPVVSTVHDINPLLPDGRPWPLRAWRRMKFAAAVRSCARRSWRIVTVTDFARESIENAFPRLRGCLTVVPNYVDRRIQRVSDPERDAALTGMGLKAGYILFVGSLRRHKNWDGLLRAYAAMPAGVRNARRLVLAGPAHRSGPQAHDLARALGVDEQSTVLGTVRDADMAALYSGAALFAFPSFMEGFGLPPLEAMACGVPVVATNRTSVPEVLGDAALYFDPSDTAAIAGCMQKVLEEPALASGLVERGRARVASFSPARTAAAMHPIIQAARVQRTLGMN